MFDPLSKERSFWSGVALSLVWNVGRLLMCLRGESLRNKECGLSSKDFGCILPRIPTYTCGNWRHEATHPKGPIDCRAGKNLPSGAVTLGLCWQKSGSADGFVSVGLTVLANSKATSAVDTAREISFLKAQNGLGERRCIWDRWALWLLTFLLKSYNKVNVRSPQSDLGRSEPPQWSWCNTFPFLLCFWMASFSCSFNLDTAVLKWWDERERAMFHIGENILK